MRTLLFAFAGLCAFAAPLQVHGVVLELRDQQTMAGENITLNDLIKSSQDVNSDDLSAVIASSPSLGKSQTFTRADIEKNAACFAQAAEH